MKPPTLFLVEDNPDDVELTLRVFKKQGSKVHVEVATDGAEAIRRLTDPTLLHAGIWPPHVVLLDLNLPKLSGMEVLQKIRVTPGIEHLPVIVLTTSNDALECKRCYELGACSFVRKPVVYEAFVEVIRQLGVYWLDINMPPPSQVQAHG
ncbi:response regulator [Magnetococcus sp. PR-3]|uniref:response regulator n=1 Tax=Magnetococcus sp. PR-3 TaxID=3120355 RepID=UPI002FCDEE34